MKNMLVTGRPGIGKTSVVEAVAREFPQLAGGFTTSEIREHGMRKGFRVTTLDGKSAELAHVNFLGRVRVGKYGVDVAAFERVALPALREAIRRGNIVVIDEIGRMELVSTPFREAVRQAFDSPSVVLATVMERRHPFADEIKRRADVTIFEVRFESRNNLPGRITASIREEFEAKR